MARIPQLGMPVYRGLIQTAFSYPAIQETTGLEVALPSSEPATAQISYTIQASDLPTMTGTQVPFKLAPTIFLRLLGQSYGISTSWKALLNGTSVATGSAFINGSQEYILSIANWGTTLPQVGDVLTVKLWGNGASLRAHAYLCDITRLMHGTKQLFLADSYAPGFITLEASEPKPSFAVAGNSSVDYLYLVPTGVLNALYRPGTHTLPAIYSDMTLGLYKSMGDASTGSNTGQSAAVGSACSYARKRIVGLRMLPLNIKL